MSLNFESRDEILIGHWVDLVYDYKTPFKNARLTICQFFASCKKSSQIIEIRKVVYRVFKLDLSETRHLLGHQKCTFKS